MALQLANIQIDELIVHDIPAKLSRKAIQDGLSGSSPVYSETSSPISTNIIAFFRSKIIDSIGSKKAVVIIFNESISSPMKQLVGEYFVCDKSRRLRITQEIGQHLFSIQNAVNSGGLLLFAHARIEDKICLAILKVEREDGIRINQIVNEQKITFDIEHIQDLLLTKKTKLFKIALFYKSDNDDTINGILCDHQRNMDDTRVYAEFFLSDFLGCTLVEEPNLSTKRFFDATQSYINERLETPEQKAEVIGHLFSEITDHHTTVNPISFAERALPLEIRDGYIRYLQENGASTSVFDKDCSLIANKVKNIRYEFSSGIYVVGSKSALAEKSRVESMTNGSTQFVILDQLKQVGAK